MEQQVLATTPPPKLEDFAIDAVLHMGAALDVLDLLLQMGVDVMARMQSHFRRGG